MAEGAKVDSIDAIKMLRIHLAKFAESGNLALGDAESEINRTLTWIETEQQSYWNGQIRKRQERLVKAEDALRQKQLYKDASGKTQSAVEEMKQVAIAKKNLAEGIAKLSACKQWVRRLQKEISMYRGGVQRIANALSGLVPAALAHLGNSVALLDQYVAAGPVSIGSTAPEAAGSMAADGGGGTMSRGAETTENPDSAAAMALWARIPNETALALASPMAAGEFVIRAPVLDEETRRAVVALGGAVPMPPAARVVVAVGMMPGQRTIVARFVLAPDALAEPAAYFGPAEGEMPSAYHWLSVAELLALRPDLEEVIAIAGGSFAVIGQGGIESMFDVQNRKRA